MKADAALSSVLPLCPVMPQHAVAFGLTDGKNRAVFKTIGEAEFTVRARKDAA